MTFAGRIKLLQPDELAGAAIYNDLARAIRHARPGSDYVKLSVSASGGMVIDLNFALLQRDLSVNAPFVTIVTGSHLTIAPGMVWLVDRKLATEKYEDKKISGDLVVAWVEIKKTAAIIRTGKQFPDFVDAKNKQVNWPLAEIELSGKHYIVTMRHFGDIMIPTMPHALIDGYDGGKTMARMLINGVEVYLSTGDCDTRETP